MRKRTWVTLLVGVVVIVVVAGLSVVAVNGSTNENKINSELLSLNDSIVTPEGWELVDQKTRLSRPFGSCENSIWESPSNSEFCVTKNDYNIVTSAEPDPVVLQRSLENMGVVIVKEGSCQNLEYMIMSAHFVWCDVEGVKDGWKVTVEVLVGDPPAEIGTPLGPVLNPEDTNATTHVWGRIKINPNPPSDTCDVDLWMVCLK